MSICVCSSVDMHIFVKFKETGLCGKMEMILTASNFQSFVVMSVDGHGAEATSSELKTKQRFAVEGSKPFIEESTKSYLNVEGHVPESTNEPIEEHNIIQPKRAAKIHDFCFGIPYGEYAV